MASGNPQWYFRAKFLLHFMGLRLAIVSSHVGLRLGILSSQYRRYKEVTTFFLSFCAPSRKKSGKLKSSYKREYINLGCNVDMDLSGPTIHGWAVLGFEGWLAGYQMAFDTAKSKLSQNNFALGYKAADFQLHTNV